MTNCIHQPWENCPCAHAAASAEKRAETPRCSLCGSTDPEDIQGDDGYSRCCNKRLDYEPAPTAADIAYERANYRYGGGL